MSICSDCCVLSGGVLCDGLITFQWSPTECDVSDCDREVPTMRRPRLTRAVEPLGKKYFNHFKKGDNTRLAVGLVASLF
jgi:hypothetical protein